MPAAWTATKTWPGPATGSSTSSSVKRLSPRQVATLTERDLSHAIPPNHAGIQDQPEAGVARYLEHPVLDRRSFRPHRLPDWNAFWVGDAFDICAGVDRRDQVLW